MSFFNSNSTSTPGKQAEAESKKKPRVQRPPSLELNELPIARLLSQRKKPPGASDHPPLPHEVFPPSAFHETAREERQDSDSNSRSLDSSWADPKFDLSNPFSNAFSKPEAESLTCELPPLAPFPPRIKWRMLSVEMRGSARAEAAQEKNEVRKKNMRSPNNLDMLKEKSVVFNVSKRCPSCLFLCEPSSSSSSSLSVGGELRGAVGGKGKVEKGRGRAKKACKKGVGSREYTLGGKLVWCEECSKKTKRSVYDLFVAPLLGGARKAQSVPPVHQTKFGVGDSREDEEGSVKKMVLWSLYGLSRRLRLKQAVRKCEELGLPPALVEQIVPSRFGLSASTQQSKLMLKRRLKAKERGRGEDADGGGRGGQEDQHMDIDGERKKKTIEEANFSLIREAYEKDPWPLPVFPQNLQDMCLPWRLPGEKKLSKESSAMMTKQRRRHSTGHTSRRIATPWPLRSEDFLRKGDYSPRLDSMVLFAPEQAGQAEDFSSCLHPEPFSKRKEDSEGFHPRSLPDIRHEFAFCGLCDQRKHSRLFDSYYQALGRDSETFPLASFDMTPPYSPGSEALQQRFKMTGGGGGLGLRRAELEAESLVKTALGGPFSSRHINMKRHVRIFCKPSSYKREQLKKEDEGKREKGDDKEEEKAGKIRFDLNVREIEVSECSWDSVNFRRCTGKSDDQET